VTNTESIDIQQRVTDNRLANKQFYNVAYQMMPIRPIDSLSPSFPPDSPMSAQKTTRFVALKNAFYPVKLSALLLFSIGTDQYSKYLAVKFLETYEETSLFNNFLKFSLIENHGGFLGIVNSLPEGVRFFLLNVCVSFLLFGCLVYLFLIRKKRSRSDIPLVFVIGGGISNLLDRLIQDGGVTDFLSVGFGEFRTGIFNLADVYILLGSFILGYYIFSTPTKST
jgi:signal peptidase II